MLLSAADEGRHPRVHRVLVSAVQDEAALPQVQRQAAGRDPAGMQLRRVEVFPDRFRRRPVGDLTHHRPAVFPGDRGEEGLPPERVIPGRAAPRPYAEEHQPPGSVGGLDEVAVAGVLYRVGRRAVGQDRVSRTGRERALRAGAAGDGDAMPPFGTSLGDHQVPGAADLVQVRRLGESEGARPQGARFLEQRAAGGVDARLLDAGDREVAGTVASQARSGSTWSCQPMVTGSDHGPSGLSAVKSRLPPPHMLVVTRKNRPSWWRSVGAQMPPELGRTRAGPAGRTFQGVAGLLPVAQVARAENRHAREVLEAGAREVVVLARPADARVGVEAGDDRVRSQCGVLPQAVGAALGRLRTRCAFGPCLRRTVSCRLVMRII